MKKINLAFTMFGKTPLHFFILAVVDHLIGMKFGIGLYLGRYDPL